MFRPQENSSIETIIMFVCSIVIIFIYFVVIMYYSEVHWEYGMLVYAVLLACLGTLVYVAYQSGIFKSKKPKQISSSAASQNSSAAAQQ